MMKILAFGFYPGLVSSSTDAQLQRFNFYRALSQLHEVTWLTVADGAAHEVCINHGAGFVERRIPCDEYFFKQHGGLQKIASGGDIIGPATAASAHSLSALHRAYLHEYEAADVIIHDSPFTGGYDLFSGLDKKLRIYNALNCAHLFYRQVHPAERSQPIHDSVYHAQLHMLQKSNVVLYRQDEDLAALRAMDPSAVFDAFYVPSELAEAALPEIASSVASLIDERLQVIRARTDRSVLVLNDYDSFSSKGGGGTRTRGLYEAVKEWSAVVLLCFSDDARLTVREHAKGITVITVPKMADHQAEQDRTNAQFHVSADDIVASRHCVKNPLLNTLYRVLREQARCVVIEHCYMVGLPAQWGDRFVYSSHNNETLLKQRLLAMHPFGADLLQDAEEVERYAIERAAVSVAVSTEDADTLLMGKRTAGPVIVVRNGAAVPAGGEAVEQDKRRLRSEILERSVVFLGSAHMPNIEAAQFIIEQLAPSCPDVQFHLVGSVCNNLGSAAKNVRLWGIVDEQTKSAVMQSCALAINPMLSGSGSNVKLADYIANGLFVVTTDFGQRGYPDSVFEHIDVVSVDGFAEHIRRALDAPEKLSGAAQAARRELFFRELAMKGLAARFVETLQALDVKRKRVLYVAHRYATASETNGHASIEQVVSALGRSGKFHIDVVTPEVTPGHSQMTLSEHYGFSHVCSAPADIPNVRFARFPLDTSDNASVVEQSRKAWRAQPRFERAISKQLSSHFSASAHAWGWGEAQAEAGHVSRWAFTECGVFLMEPATLVIRASTPDEVVITARSGDSIVGGPWIVKGDFTLEMAAPAGHVEFVTSAAVQKEEPRPIAFLVSQLVVSGSAIDLALPPLWQRGVVEVPGETTWRILDQATTATRSLACLRLTDVRGPWSGAMERFIADHVGDYDLLVTHDTALRPAVVAIAEAKKQGVASLLIAHGKLDDALDWLQSARAASLVLAEHEAAVAFLREKGCNAHSLPAGDDTAFASAGIENEVIEHCTRLVDGTPIDSSSEVYLPGCVA